MTFPPSQVRSSNQVEVHRAENARHPVAIAILFLCVGLALNCSTDAAAPSEPPEVPIVTEARTISELYLGPAGATLYTTGTTTGTPGTLGLYVEAFDRSGQRMDVSQSVTFASSLPAVATVDERGIVRAVAPGDVKITATVTTGLITRSASIIVSVHEPPVLNLSGTYDLYARGYLGLTDDFFDYTAVFSFPGPSVTVGQIGTFTDWQVLTPEGKAIGLPRSGTIWLFFLDRPVLSLVFANVVSDPAAGQSVLLGVETIAESSTSDRSLHSLTGSWRDGVWAAAGGTFTAIRRGP